MSSTQTTAALIQRYGERFRWYLLLAALAGTITSIIPATSMNLAIPALSAHFGVGQGSAQWVASGFMVASTMAMLTTPWLLARYGYRRTYVGALLLLMAGGIVGGVTPDYSLLLAARVAEGIASGIIQPIPAVIILHAFPPTQQGRAGGLFAMGVVLAPAIAPTLGGLLVDWLGWRSTFFMVVPPAMLSWWLAQRFVPTSAPGGAVPDNAGGLDWGGLALASAGTLCLLNGLASLQNGTPGTSGALLAATVLCLWGFILWQKRRQQRSQPPLMDLRLFHTLPFVMGCLVSFIFGAALFGSTYLLPLFIQLGLGLSATEAGTLMLPAGLVLAALLPIGGRLADSRPIHWMVIWGMVLLTLSFALMHWVGSSTALWMLATVIVLGRIGMGFILPSLNTGTLRPLPRPLISQGASTLSFIRMLGGAAGVGLCGIVVEWRLAAHTAQTALPAARLQAFHETFWLLTALCLLAACAAWQLRAAPAGSPPAGP